jgi:formamidopyrimidine-DNA glycosylase
MPELPDVTLYVEHLSRRITGFALARARVWSLNLLRSVDPPLERAFGRTVRGVSRLGKRIVLALEGDLHLLFHLMIAGRFHWHDAPAPPGPRRPRKIDLAELEFSSGTLRLTEAST